MFPLFLLHILTSPRLLPNTRRSLPNSSSHPQNPTFLPLKRSPTSPASSNLPMACSRSPTTTSSSRSFPTLLQFTRAPNSSPLSLPLPLLLPPLLFAVFVFWLARPPRRPRLLLGLLLRAVHGRSRPAGAAVGGPCRTPPPSVRDRRDDGPKSRGRLLLWHGPAGVCG